MAKKEGAVGMRDPFEDLEVFAGWPFGRRSPGAVGSRSGEQSHYVERFYGSFTRSFTFPSNADGEHVKARFEHGALTITIPKLEATRPQVVAIES